MKEQKKKRIAAIATAVAVLGAGAGIAGKTILVPEETTNKIVGTEIREDYEALEEMKEYTVLIYMNGSDLESDGDAATEDMEEMQSVVKEMYREDEEMNFHLVLETGSSAKWKEQSRFAITPSGIKHLETMEPRNMGEAGTLADFLNYGTMSFPGKKNILIFWNHGNGPVGGFGSDENYDGDSLELQEIAQAFSLSRMQKQKFELVGFDACLMGTAETAYMMPSNVRYMAASSELEPEEGWNYKWLKILGKSRMTGKKIGREIGKTYLDSQKEQRLPLELTVTDVKQFKAKCKAWDAKLKEIAWDEEKMQEILKARDAMQKYQTGTGTSSLVGFEDTIRLLCEEEQEETLLKGVTEKIGNEEAQENKNTLSVYFPDGTPDYRELKIYEGCGFLDGYFKMLKCFYDTSSGEKFKYEEKTAQIQNETITAPVSPQEAENIRSVVQLTYLKGENGERYIISSDTDVTLNLSDGTLRAKVPTYYMALQDHIMAALEESVTQNEKEDYVKVISPVFHNGTLAYISVKYSEDYPDGEVLGVIPVSEDGNSRKELRSLENGDRIIPLYPMNYGGEKDGKITFYKGQEFVVKWKDEDRCMQSVKIGREFLEYEFLMKMK